MPRSFRLLLSCILLCLGSAWAGEPAWTSRDGRLALELGPSHRVTTGSKRAWGGATLEFDQGRAFPMMAKGHRVGYWYVGGASLAYPLSDPHERAVAELTLSKNSLPPSVATKGGKMLLLPVQALAIWTQADLFPEPDGGQPADPKPFQDFMMDFRKLGGFEALAHVLEQALQPSPGDACVLEFRGVGNDWVYGYDPLESHSESLAHRRDLNATVAKEGQILCTLTPILEHALGQDTTDPKPPRVLLTHVKLDISSPDNRTLRVEAQERYKFLQPNQRVLSLSVLDSVWEPSSIGGQLVPLINQVRLVADASGKPLPYHRVGDSLIVELPTSPAAGAEVEFKFVLEGPVLITPYGDRFWLLDESNWFPVPEFHERNFTVEAKMATVKPYRPLLPGDQVSFEEKSNTYTTQSRITRPVQMYWALAGNYTMIQDTRGGQTIRVAAYGLEGANAKVVLNLAFDVISYYEGFLGPFPFKDYLIAQVPQLGYGIAPPGLQLITNEAFKPFNDPFTTLFTGGINHRIAHEVAHQYWPHVVHIPDLAQGWLSESFAEYSSALFIKASKGGGQPKFDQMASGWYSKAKDATELAPLHLANRLLYWRGDYRGGSWARNHLVYDKGAYLLYTLHREMGDIPFLKYLRAIQANFKDRPITITHLQGLLEFMTKKDYSNFFKDYVRGTQLPPK